MKTSALKRTLAGALAVLCVAGSVPANVNGGGLFDTAIVASADNTATGWTAVFAPDYEYQYTAPMTFDDEHNIATFTASKMHSRSAGQGRPEGRYWVGTKLTAPEGVTAIKYNGADASDGEEGGKKFIYVWTGFTAEEAVTAINSNKGIITKTWSFKAVTNETESDYTFTVKIDVKNTELLGVDNNDTVILRTQKGKVTYSANSELTDISADIIQDYSSGFMKYVKKYNKFDIQGINNGDPISTTYVNGGYRTYMQVGNGDITRVSEDDYFYFGKVYDVDGVQIRIVPEFTDNGRSLTLKYQLHNTTGEPKTVKFGSCGDTEIDGNDTAAVSIVDNYILMENASSGIQFRVYLDGKDTTAKKWCGLYQYYNGSDTINYYDHVFDNDIDPNYATATNKDSAVAWSWEVDIPANGSIEKAATQKVLRSLEILDSTVTADVKNKQLKLHVPYNDKANLKQTLYYKIDEGNEQEGGTATTTSEILSNHIDKTIDVSTWEPGSTHTIKVWLTNSAEPSITSATLTYNVYWPEDIEEQTNTKTLKLSTTSGTLFADVKAAVGTEYKLPTDTRTEQNLVFMGWCENEDGSGKIYSAGDSYEINEDKTLYAIWHELPKISVYPTAKNPTHYSSPVELINAGESEVGTLYYSLGTASAPGSSWTENASEITADSAGTFYVWYMIDEDESTLDMITVTVSQGKLSQSWSILIDSYEYDGTAHLPTIDGTAYGTLTYSYYNIDTDEVNTQAPSAVGNYRVTATASGNENYIAAVRQASYSITEAKAAEPIIVRARNAYFTGLMDLVVKFKLPESVTSDSKAYVEYSWTEGTEKRTEKKLVSELTTGKVGEDKVYVVENPVYAPEMENKVTYKFFDGNGKQLNMANADGTEMYKDGYQFSLRDYLDLAMANGNDDMKALADAAYDYGIASQINFKYGDYQNLKVSDKVKAVKLSDLEKYKLTESGTLPEIIKNVKYSVEFAMDNTLRVKFNFKKAPTDAELKSLTCTIDGKAAELVKLGDTQYALVVSNIAAPQIDTAHTFTISDGTNTYTTVRSALSYAYSAIEANSNPTLVDLAKAMYLYNQAANEKFAE